MYSCRQTGRRGVRPTSRISWVPSKCPWQKKRRKKKREREERHLPPKRNCILVLAYLQRSRCSKQHYSTKCACWVSLKKRVAVLIIRRLRAHDLEASPLSNEPFHRSCCCNDTPPHPTPPRPPLTTVEYACRRQSTLPRNLRFPLVITSVPTLVRAKSKGYKTASETAPEDAPESSDNPRYVQKCSIGTPRRYNSRNLLFRNTGYTTSSFTGRFCTKMRGEKERGRH